MAKPIMARATAVWLVDNTMLTFKQIADFVGMHELEVQGIADGDVATGVKGFDPITNSQLDADEIKKAEVEIDTLRQSDPEKINKIAVVTSTEILKKLIGAEVNNSSISAIVDDLVKKNGDKYYGH